MSKLSDATEWYTCLANYYEYLYEQHRAIPRRRFIYRWRVRRAREKMWQESGQAFKEMVRVWGNGD